MTASCVVASNREVEARALIGCRGRPHAAPVAGYDAFDDRKSDPGALVVLCAVQPLEDAEQLVGILHVETNAVVPHKICFRRPIDALAAHVDGRMLAAAREFQRVAQEIHVDLLEQHRIGVARRQRRH